LRRNQNRLQGANEDKDICYSLSKHSIESGHLDSGVERSEPFNTAFNCIDQVFHPESVVVRISFNPYLKRVCNDSDRSMIYKRAHTNSFLGRSNHLPIKFSPTSKEDKFKFLYSSVASHLPRLDLPPGITTPQHILPSTSKSASIHTVPIKSQSLQDKFVIDCQEKKIAHLLEKLASQKNYYDSELSRYKVPYTQAFHEGMAFERLAEEKRRFALSGPDLNPVIIRAPSKQMLKTQALPCLPGIAPDTNSQHNNKRNAYAAKLLRRSKEFLAYHPSSLKLPVRPFAFGKYAKLSRRNGRKFSRAFASPKHMHMSSKAKSPEFFSCASHTVIVSPCPSPLFSSFAEEEIDKDLLEFAENFDMREEVGQEHAHDENMSLMEVPEVEPYSPSNPFIPGFIPPNPLFDMDMD
jgi:hypothetical protein